MNECYYYLLLLSLLILYKKTISINLPNVTIQHVCEHDLLSIKCSNENETIQVVRSMYGRTSQRICNNDLTNQVFYKTCANIEQSKNQTKFRCNGKSTCEILVDNTIYNDPCGLTVPKHFEIHYRCINVDKICSELIENCLKTKDLNCIKKIDEEYSCSCPSTLCHYDHNNQLISFKEQTCLAENFQGNHWPKTLVNKGQYMSCPYPCIGQIFRYCQMNNQWTKPNYTDCQCPIQKSNQLSMHHLNFQCNFWLINRLLPKDNQCSFETDDNDSDTCLLSAFQKMSSTSCKTFRMDFKNIGFEVFIPMKNENKFRFNQIIVDKTNKILPMMVIDRSFNSTIKSMTLIEQSTNLSSIQTANVTVIFNHRSTENRYQCRAYRSTNSSFQIDTSDIFFVCQLLCSNGSHIICQCPFYNPLMHYVLHVDTSITKDDFEYSMIENNLNDKCSINYNSTRSFERSIEKIDYYLKNFSSFNQKKNLAKKLLSFIDTLIDDENFQTNWKKLTELIRQLEFLRLNLTDSFNFMKNYIEFYVNSSEWESSDGSIRISTNNQTFFILSNIDQYLNSNQSSNKLNSHIININPKDNLQITFRHLNVLNDSNQISTCVYLDENQWNTDGCFLISSNSTHSVCSCKQGSTFAVVKNFKLTEKPHRNRLLFLTKIGTIVSMICLILMIILLIIRYRMDVDDDLRIVRNILHINLAICLLIAQVLFIFSVEQRKSNFVCRIIAILFHYFLLATFSWMFVDGIELIIALKNLFKIDRIRVLAYALYSYGFPLLILILSISLSNYDNHSNKHCWFSYDNPFIWAFGIPIILLILTNICFLILSVYTICKHLHTSNPSQQIGFHLRDITILSILFGITWLIGLFYLHEQYSIIFSYIFTILNSFQGLFIFIFYCLLDKQIQQIILHQILNRYRKPLKDEKSTQHYNTSSSGYSSAQSSEINKLDNHLSYRTNHPEYLSSMPNGLLTTFRYPTTNIPITLEQNEQLLKKFKIDLHHDEHQYYEIG